MEKRKLDVSVVSDVHLGTYGSKANELVQYLRSIQPQILILNGDIIDGWQFNKRYFPKAHLQVLKEVLCMMTHGTRVIYITGNHDEMLRRYSDIELGNFLLTDKLVMEINGKMTWIFHGDVFDNTTQGAARFWAKLGSTGYGMLILINRLINRLLRLFGKERWSMSKAVMDGVNKAIVKMNRFIETAAEQAIQKKYDYVICGHLHHPEKKLIHQEQGSVTYLNSGDWVENMTALEYYKNDWHIYRHETAEHHSPVREELSVPLLNVVTDEINLYLKSMAI